MPTKPFSFQRRLKETSMFFQSRDEVHKTMRRLVKRLEKADIPYAIVGGMAVNAHRHRRTTSDVDVLFTSQGFDEFRRLFVPKHYQNLPGRSRRFVDRKNQVNLMVTLTGYYPGRTQVGPITFPDPEQAGQVIEKIQVINLPTLVQLKLAARRYQDSADVVELIRFNNLDESYAEKLHPSLQRDFIECLEEKRREDEFEARE
jgi:hypothetical protein